MGPDIGFRDGPSQYAGEDTRLTSRKELNGWFAYGFAAEVFVICGMGELDHFNCWEWRTWCCRCVLFRSQDSGVKAAKWYCKANT